MTVNESRPSRPIHLSTTASLRWPLALLGIALMGSYAGAASLKPAEAASEYHKTIQPLLQKYCYDCHADGEKKGGVELDQFKTDQSLSAHPDIWWRAIKNVRAGIMPPLKKPQPTPEEKEQLAKWIKYGAFGLDPASPDPGRVTIRRLNRVEYRNTIRDLMGVDYNTTEEFPPDDTGYGFDTIGDVLSVSPMLLEKYLKAAEAIVTGAVPTVSRVAPETLLLGKRFHAEGIRGEKLSFYKDADLYCLYTASHAGDYQFQVDIAVSGSFNFDPGKCSLSFKVDDKELLNEKYQWIDHKDYRYTITAPMTAGEHRLSFTLHPLVAEQPKKADAAAASPFQQQQQTSVDLRIVSVDVVGPMDRKFWAPSPQYLRFFPKADPPESPSEQRAYATEILRNFATRAFRRPVDDEMLNRLVNLAEANYSQPGRRFEQGVAQAMIAVLASPRFIFRIEKPAPGTGDKPWSNVDDYALASRLSYFFWSTMPDQELFDLAKRGELHQHLDAEVKRMLADPRSQALVQNFVGQWLETRDMDSISIDARVVLAQDAGKEKELAQQLALFQAQIRKNGQAPVAQAGAGAGTAGLNAKTESAPSSASTAEKSASGAGEKGNGATEKGVAAAGQKQPQGAGQFGNGQRNRNRFRFFTPAVQLDGQLRKAMEEEVQDYFTYVMHEDRSVLDFLDSDYTFVNQKLAKVYGIADVNGTEMRRVTLPADSWRGGMLTMGSMLVVTSNPTRTSPVKRGQFILDNILGMPAPPPPGNLPALEASDHSKDGKSPSFREVLEIHRSKPLCKSCHARMDPLGLSLENFNALGMYRTSERGLPIDATGKLLTGEPFHDIRDLKKIIVAKHRDDFYRCLTEKLLTYALGRGLDYYDVESVDQIVARLERDNGRFSALITGIVESAPFQERRNFVQPPRVHPAAPTAQPPEEQRASSGTPFGHEQRTSS